MSGTPWKTDIQVSGLWGNSEVIIKHIVVPFSALRNE